MISSKQTYRCTIQTHNGCFLSADQGQDGLLTAKGKEAKAWEIFQIEVVNGEKVNIRSMTQQSKLLSAEGGGGGSLRCNRTVAKDWELFLLQEVAEGGIFHIQCHKKLYLSASNGGGGSVSCDRKKPDKWEQFRVVNLDVTSFVVAPIAASPYGYAAPAPAGYYSSAPPAQNSPYGNYAVSPTAPAGPGYGYTNAPAYQYPPPQQQAYASYTGTVSAAPSWGSPVAPPPAAVSASPIAPPVQRTSSSRLSGSLESVPLPKPDQDIIVINPGHHRDIQAAHTQIGDFCMVIKALDGLISDKLNPISEKKGTLSKLKMKRSSSRSSISLVRDEKNTILTHQRHLAENFNMFLFDWNRYSKDLSERDFNKIALMLGSFIENLKEFKESVVKSDTVLESTSKLLEKFASVNIKFEQQISYSNTSTSSANFNHLQTIVDQGQTHMIVDHSN